jgi:hypothetical protein
MRLNRATGFIVRKITMKKLVTTIAIALFAASAPVAASVAGLGPIDIQDSHFG